MRLRSRAVGVVALAAVLFGAACAGILGLRKSGVRRFEHRTHVLAGVSCTKCHKNIETAGEEGPLHIPDTATCLSCHAKPHDTHECTSCHSHPFAKELAAEARRHLRFQHKNHIPRVNGNCVRCHTEIASEDDFIRPKMATCFGCHPHKDTFKVSKCDGCHVNLRTENTRPESHLAHDDDFIERHGLQAAAARDLCSTCHAETFCAGCHGKTVPLLAERKMFDATMKAGIHRAGFRSRHSDQARAEPGLCLTCHAESSCRDCHTANDISATRGGLNSPHSGGWVGLKGTPNRHGMAARTNPMECASCHSGAGEALCVGCHREGGQGGSPHPLNWDSNSSKLDITRDRPCRLCHVR